MAFITWRIDTKRKAVLATTNWQMERSAGQQTKNLIERRQETFNFAFKLKS